MPPRRRPYLRSPNTPGGVGCSRVAEHSERMRVGWIDTDAGGRIHFTVAFRWAETAETGLYRKLGLLEEGRGDYPRRHVEADYLRVLVLRRRGRGAHPRRLGRANVDSLRLGGRCTTARSRSPAATRSSTSTPTGGRRRSGERDASTLLDRRRLSGNLILSRARRTRRATGIPTSPGSPSWPTRSRDASRRVRRGAVAVPGRAGGRRPRRVLGRARPRSAGRGSARRRHDSATSCRSSTRGGRRSSATRPSTASTGGCSIPYFSRARLAALEEPLRQLAREMIDRLARRSRSRRLRRADSATRSRRARSACCSRLPDDDWHADQPTGRAGSTRSAARVRREAAERIAVGEELRPVHDRR